jgi:hypothetical protein
MHNFTSEQVLAFKRKIQGKKIPFIFVPSSSLCELVIKDEHPYIKCLPQLYKKAFMEKNAIAINPDIVIKYLDKKLDERNTFILDRGEIRVVEDGFKIKENN